MDGTRVAPRVEVGYSITGSTFDTILVWVGRVPVVTGSHYFLGYFDG